MKVQVLVRLKPGVLDVQGKAVEKGVGQLGFEGVGDVRVGKLIEFSLDTSDPKLAMAQADKMCKELLTNPIIEHYEVQIHETGC